MIPYGKQSISKDDIEVVVNVLKSDWLTQGPTVPKFEQAIANKCNVKYAVAVNSATSALEIACQSLGLGPGKRLWTVPNTFVASANCALRCGASIDFVDITSDTHNMCVNALTRKLVEADTVNELPHIVVPVHFAGHSCDMKAIGTLAKKYGFKVVEDAAHAIGGTYDGNAVGSCKWSDATVFSFHPVKIITAAEGGMVLTNNHALAQDMELRRSHGITKSPEMFTKVDAEPWHYEQIILGANYRLTDIQAALALSQLKRINEFIGRRRNISAKYDAAFKPNQSIITPVERPDAQSAWHLYTIEIVGGPKNRKSLYDFLRSKGVGVQIHYIPVHLQPYYRDLGFREGDFPIAEKYASRTISLPLYPDMTDDDVAQVIDIVNSASAVTN
ncbi:MAG: UDP-4-amino-4,6-dideoxy-N-acetyl-beta-L-altrosamine transaminase [Rhodospirillaceae bacterium]|nr:UDP-4-amino-4,6-dideoxy-N-acetyl-beta-L-altrosamine transaminase [Rhodospirillaceae bacterium]